MPKVLGFVNQKMVPDPDYWRGPLLRNRASIKIHQQHQFCADSYPSGCLFSSGSFCRLFLQSGAILDKSKSFRNPSRL